MTSFPKESDVVIIGGGIIGVSTAYYLAKSGVSVSLVEKGIIAGAGLDVFEKEPLGDSPLLSFENVVLTPHTAGSTIDTWWRRLDFAFENIQRVSRGEDPTFIVEV